MPFFCWERYGPGSWHMWLTSSHDKTRPWRPISSPPRQPPIRPPALTHPVVTASPWATENSYHHILHYIFCHSPITVFSYAHEDEIFVSVLRDTLHEPEVLHEWRQQSNSSAPNLHRTKSYNLKFLTNRNCHPTFQQHQVELPRAPATPEVHLPGAAGAEPSLPRCRSEFHSVLPKLKAHGSSLHMSPLQGPGRSLCYVSTYKICKINTSSFVFLNYVSFHSTHLHCVVVTGFIFGKGLAGISLICCPW